MRETVMGVPANPDVTWEVMSQQIKDLILLADATGRIFYASPACARLGYLQQDIIGRRGAEFIHPDDLPAFTAEMQELVADDGADAPCSEYWFRRKDESWACLEGNPSVLRGPDGQAVGVLTVLRDTTARHSVNGAKRAPRDIASDAA